MSNEKISMEMEEMITLGEIWTLGNLDDPGVRIIVLTQEKWAYELDSETNINSL